MISDRVFARLRKKTLSFQRDEDGSLIILSLFLFVIILFTGGIAVDVMLNEEQRVRAQTTLDTAIVSASSINQKRDPEQVIKDYVALAGLDPDRVSIPEEVKTTNGVTVTGRSMAAKYEVRTGTMFMNLLGIDSLKSVAGGRAEEGTTEIEIALVLDISGSMNEDGKIDDLKSAAKQFVTTVLTNTNPEKVNISIVPYNHQVYMTDVMRATIPLRSGSDPDSRCAYFSSNARFDERSILDNNGTLRMGSIFVNDRNFSYENNGQTNVPFAHPYEWSKWCNEQAPRIKLFSNNELDLHTYIDNLTALEGTSIDYGMKWGVAVLDPSMQPTISAMYASGELTAAAVGHPFPYEDNDIFKFIVLMTDGQNEFQYDMRWKYRNTLSPVWYSRSRAGGVAFSTSPYPAGVSDFNGYIIERPDNPPEQRWFAPGDPATNADDVFIAEGALPFDVQRLNYREIYKRFSVMDATTYFFLPEPTDAASPANDVDEYVAHADAAQRTGRRNSMNARTRRACDAAKANDRITVFTVAFDATSNAQSLLQDCASGPDNYFDAGSFGAGMTVQEAFQSIAAELAVLRMIN